MTSDHSGLWLSGIHGDPSESESELEDDIAQTEETRRNQKKKKKRKK